MKLIDKAIQFIVELLSYEAKAVSKRLSCVEKAYISKK
jgi:hypothetical protein